MSPLLLEADTHIFENKLQQLIYTDIGAALVCVSLADVLLYWQIHQFRPSYAIAESVLRSLFCHQELLAQSVAEQFLCNHLLTSIFGCEKEAIEFTLLGEPEHPTLDRSYWLANRYAAAGLLDYIDKRSLVDVARDCCLFLNRCEYIGAYRSLGWLKWLQKQSNQNEYTEIVDAFIAQAEPYLDDILSLYPSPTIAWERTLMAAIVVSEHSLPI